MADPKETVEEPVNFIDDDSGDTIVELGGTKEPKESKEEKRWEKAERELSDLRSTIQTQRQQDYGTQRQPVMDDPFESDEIALNEREKALGISWEADRVAGKLGRDPVLVADYEKKAREIQSRKAEITTNRAIRNALPNILQAQQAQQFRMQYSDVYQNPRATQYAEAEYHKLLALGETDGPQLVDKAMNTARVQFKMAGSSMKPTDKDRSQLTGVGGGGGRNTVDNTVRMGKAEKSMAMAMYGEQFNGDEKKVYQKWASGPGLRAKKAASKSRNA